MQRLSWAVPAPLVLAALSPNAPAQAPMDLGTTVVTATRTAQTVDKTLAAVTVISRDDIERLQARSLEDVFETVPGAQVVNNGGLGQNTSLLLRGTNADHVLVLVDGIRVGSATLGLTAFQDLPLSQIDRIEVVRGPRSSLYGSEAVGGVVQIFTRKGGDGFRPYASVTAGTYETREGTLGVSGGDAQGWYNLGVSAVRTEGFDSCLDFSACFADDPDEDGYGRHSANLRAGYRLEGGPEIDLHFLHAEGDNEFDRFVEEEAETVQQVLGGTVRFAPLRAWNVTLKAGRSRDESTNLMDGVPQSRFDTRRHTMSWQNDVTLAPGQLLTLGADYHEDEIESSEPFPVTSRHDLGIFGQYQAGIDAHDLQLSLRHDDNEQFGSHTTGSVAWGMNLNDGLRVTASYGTAFKAPSFNELYFPGFGNPDLEPERSSTVEVGLESLGPNGTWSLRGFETRIDDWIPAFPPENVNEARIRGLEAEGATKIGGWHLSGSVTLLDPENRSEGDDKGNVLPRRARQSAHLDANRSFGPLSLGLALRAQSHRYDRPANEVRMGGYALIDLRGEYRLGPDWRVQARIANALDKDYETAAFFQQPGRSLFVTLRYEPES